MRIRLLTYNIHKCIGGVDRRYRPERVLSVIGHYEPDLLLLQEVDEGARRSRRDRQVEFLARSLRLSHRIFHVNVRALGGGGYGNAVVSRHPIASSRNLSLTLPGRKRRSVLYARLSLAAPRGGPPRVIHVFNLHLGLSDVERRWQMGFFLGNPLFTRLDPKEPVIVAGDFNDVWGRLGRTFLEPSGFGRQHRPSRTFPAWAPVRALDGIYVRGGIRVHQMFRSQLKEARFASDHLPLFADLELT